MEKGTPHQTKYSLSKRTIKSPYPKLSIVTPSFNQGQFLEQTINSVLSQEGDFFIDYIIADGGSTDNSVEIIKKYERLLKNKEYPVKCRGINFYWWSRKDKGQSDAINQGFKKSRGDILAWINSDDVYLFKDTIKRVVRAFQKYKKADIIFGDIAFINKEGQILRFYKYQEFNYEKLLRYRYNLGQPAVFFKAKVLKEDKLREDLHYVMDYELWLRLGKKYKFKHIPEVLAGFRVYTESKSGKEKDKKCLEERKKILIQYGGEEENRFIIKILDKILRGGNARLKGLVDLIKYRYINKTQLAFNGKYLVFPLDILRQLIYRIR